MKITARFMGHTEAEEGVSASSGNAWRKITAIFETIEDMPKTMAFTVMNSTCERVATLVKGSIYEVNFDLRSRSWTDPKTGRTKWFTDAKAWGILDTQRPQMQEQPHAAQYENQSRQPSPAPQQMSFGGVDFPVEADDLPF